MDHLKRLIEEVRSDLKRHAEPLRDQLTDFFWAARDGNAADEITRLRAELAEARNKALEDAASLAGIRWFAWATLENPPECGLTACEEIAAAIRAMKEPKT